MHRVLLFKSAISELYWLQYQTFWQWSLNHFKSNHFLLTENESSVEKHQSADEPMLEEVDSCRWVCFHSVTQTNRLWSEAVSQSTWCVFNALFHWCVQPEYLNHLLGDTSPAWTRVWTLVLFVSLSASRLSISDSFTTMSSSSQKDKDSSMSWTFVKRFFFSPLVDQISRLMDECVDSVMYSLCFSADTVTPQVSEALSSAF